MNPSITAHMVVKNDDQWVGYAIRSVLPYVDQFLITDTGSTDRTVETIHSIKDQKIILMHQKINHPAELVAVRQSQLHQTGTDWLWMVDGDEIYPRILGEEITEHLKSDLTGVIVRRFDCLGDIYHYQPDETVGGYSMFGQVRHYSLRLVNLHTPGLHLAGEYPNEGFYDRQGKAIIKYPKENFYLTKNRYLHTTYLSRSSLGKNLKFTLHRQKYKVERGRPLDPQFHPEVISTSPHRSIVYELLALIITPLKMVKRKFTL